MFEDDWNVTINKEASDIMLHYVLSNCLPSSQLNWKVSNCLKLTFKKNIKILETWEFKNSIFLLSL